MGRIFAVHHIGLGHRRYEPGDELPQDAISDARWTELMRSGAIRTEHDPVEAVLDDGGDEPQDGKPVTCGETGNGHEERDAGGDGKTQSAESEREDIPDALMHVDALTGIAEDEPVKPAKRRPRAKAGERENA